jgi:hypothetical protein
MLEIGNTCLLSDRRGESVSLSDEEESVPELIFIFYKKKGLSTPTNLAVRHEINFMKSFLVTLCCAINS